MLVYLRFVGRIDLFELFTGESDIGGRRRCCCMISLLIYVLICYLRWRVIDLNEHLEKKRNDLTLTVHAIVFNFIDKL
jgi:hypothetical protein